MKHENAASNLPVLYQNILFGLPSEISRDAFLWAVEQPGENRMCYRAEAFAREVGRLADALSPMLEAAAGVHGLDCVPEGLMQFILTRHANWRFGGNQHPTYARAA